MGYKQDSRGPLAKDMARDFGWNETDAKRVIQYIFDSIVHRVMDQGEVFAAPRFGVFERRLVAHGKRVFNNYGEGGVTKPKFALRFKRSKRFTSIPLEEPQEDNG